LIPDGHAEGAHPALLVHEGGGKEDEQKQGYTGEDEEAEEDIQDNLGEPDEAKGKVDSRGVAALTGGSCRGAALPPGVKAGSPWLLLLGQHGVALHSPTRSGQKNRK
jgi:hypothetical protein